MTQSATVEKPVGMDADELQGQWGVTVAFEMFRDGLITARDCLSLCQEATQSTIAGGAPGSRR